MAKGEEMYGSGIVLPKAVLEAQVDITAEEPRPVEPVPVAHVQSGKKVWDVPIIMRQNLRESLNALAENDFEIFQILPVDREKVQLVCYKEIPRENS